MHTIILTGLWEILKAAIFRIGWRIVAERFVSRLIPWGLRKLANMTTNTLDDATVEDIIQQLERPDLPALK